MAALYRTNEQFRSDGRQTTPFIDPLLMSILEFGIANAEQRRISFPKGWRDILKDHIPEKSMTINARAVRAWPRFDNEGEKLFSAFHQLTVRSNGFDSSFVVRTLTELM